jgi:hypothetical protein
MNLMDFYHDSDPLMNDASREKSSIDLVKLVKERDRQFLLSNVDYLEVLFHSVGIRLVRKECNDSDVSNSSDSTSSLNNYGGCIDANSVTSTSTNSNDFSSHSNNGAFPRLSHSVSLQFRLKLPQSVYLRLAQVCCLLAFDPNYFLSDVTWLTIAKDLRMSTTKILYLGENADLM